ncbi:DUF3108 domain-containing protein [Puteibacter caeruleilacunae]|nr:DUF3108 domain-containing protein [Puteibacter caeruleilacunae]
MLKVISLITLVLLTCRTYGQLEQNYAFKAGESITYGAYYNWHFIWINAGKVDFSVDTTSYNEKPAYRFLAKGYTFPGYDKIYKVRDQFESYTDYMTLAPLAFYRQMKHRKKFSSHQYTFDQSNSKVYSKVKRYEEAEIQDTLLLNKGVHDLLSSAYYARCLDISKYNKGDKIPFDMIIDNKVSNSYLRYQGKEVVKTRNGRKFRCIKFSAYLLEGDFFNQGESMVIWVTDDKNRLPIIVETEVLIGSVKAILEDFKHIKYPLESEIIK